MKQIAHIRFLFVAFFALAAAQSAWAAVIDMGGNTASTTDLGAYQYNNVAIKNNELRNGTLNVTGNQAFDDDTFTFGSGLTVNQTANQWGISGSRTVKFINGAVLNYTSTSDIYFGRTAGGQSYDGTTQFILEGGVVNASASLYFSPKATSGNNGKNVVLNFIMLNDSSLTLPTNKELRFGEVSRDSSYTHATVKVTAAVTNSTITAKLVRIGQTNSYISDTANSFNNITFGTGTVLNVGQVYSYAYPAPTVVFDGAKICWNADAGDSIIGQNNGVTTSIYTIGPNGIVIDKQNGFSRTEVSGQASALSGTGGITKTGPGNITWNTGRIGGSAAEPMTFTGPLVISNGTWTSTLGYAASAFRADGGTLVLSGALSAANVALAATEGGTLTLTGATITDVSPDMTLAGGGTTDYFTRDGAVGTYALDSLTLGEGAVLDLDADATTVDVINATTTSITATSANPATVNINFTAAPAAGATFTFFETDSADKFTVVPKLGNITLLHEESVVDGRLVMAIVAEDYTWKGSQSNWGDENAWTKGGADATWADGNNAIFATPSATASLSANATANKVSFTADATVSGSATLTAFKVNVYDGVSATISAPTAGTLEKIGAGTLTLGASRTDQTTLSEGTLALTAGNDAITVANLTLGTDAAKPIALDYGGNTLSAKWTDYLTPGMDITLTNGTFSTTQNPGWTAATFPKTLTIAKGATMTTSERFTWNVSDTAGAYVTNYVNIAGGLLVSTKDNNNWIVQNSRSGTLKFDVSDGGLLELSGQTYILPCRDSTTENDTPSVLMTFNDSTFRVKNKHLFLGYDNESGTRKNPLEPIFELAMTNSTLNVGTGSIKLGHNVVQSNHGGHSTADFENCIITAKQFTVYYDRPANAARFNNSTIVLTAAGDYSLEAQADWDVQPGEEWAGRTPITVGPGGLTLDTQNNTGCGVTANIAGGPVTKKGTGTLTIRINQTSTSALNVNEGTVAIASDVTLSRAISVASGATLSLASLSTETPVATASSFSFASGSTLALPAITAKGKYKLFTLSSGTFASDPLASATISGLTVPYTITAEGDTVYLNIAHDYAVVGNTGVSSLAVTDDTVLFGVGGAKLSALAFGATGKLTFDPIKTPIKVSATPTFAEGAKIALSSDYAAMSCGRVVLMTYSGEATIPEGLFDSSSVSGTATLSQETAPDGTSKQLVLTVGDYANAPEIRILPIGDSITQGVTKDNQGDYPQYRTSIAARLAASGYKPVMKGIWHYAQNDAAGVQQPDEWRWHCGISGDSIKTSPNTATSQRGGVRDNLHLYLDIAGNTDVITLLIGTNDIGSGGETAEETYTTWTNLVFEISAQRPNAKIVASTLLDRNGEETENHAKVVAFNAYLRADYEAHNLPANLVLLDLYGAVPLATTGNFFSDKLHMNWNGCAAAADAFAGKIMEALPLPSFTGTVDATVTDEVQAALGAAATVPAAYRAGMTHVFTLDAANAGNVFFGSAPYTTTNSVVSVNRVVTKVGYYMELVRVGTNRRRYVWVDFNVDGKTLEEVDFPWTGSKFQTIVDDLHVYSNDSSIHNIAADATGYKGIVEATSANYSATDAIADAPNDILGSSATLGWNDTLTDSGAGYGCFQAHRIFSQEAGDTHWNDAQVLFAWNRWGKNSGTDEIGIGDYSCHASGVGNTMDYTFTADKGTDGLPDTVAAGAYQVRHLEIWAVPVIPAESQHGKWIGGAGSNMSTPANWEDNIAPVAGDTLDFSGVTSSITINCGDMGETKFGAVTNGTGVITFIGSFTATSFSDTSKIAVGASSTVTLDGDLLFDAQPGTVLVNKVDADGNFVVTGVITANDKNIEVVGHSGAGTLVVGGIVINGSEKWLYTTKDGTSQNWAIGPQGISGTGGIWCRSNKSNDCWIYPNTNDFSISVWTVVRELIDHHELNTTGYGDGLPHTITLDAGFSDKGAIFIAGTGKVVVNHITQAFGGKSACSSPVTVQDSATLAINADKKLTTGTITFAAGTTLEVPSTGVEMGAIAFSGEGTVTLKVAGDATLADGTYTLVTSSSALTNNVLTKFSLDASLVKGSSDAWLEVSGNGKSLVLNIGDRSQAAAGTWVGGSGDFSTAANWKNGQVPVAGDALDFSGVTANMTITCSDLGETAFGAVNLGTTNRQITINGTLRVASMTVAANNANFSVAAGSKLIVDGDVTLNSSSSVVLYIVYENYGEVEIGRKVIVSGKAKGYACYKCSDSATIAVKGIECTSSGDHFKFNANEKNSPTVKWIVGKDGLGGSGSKSYWIDRGDGNSKHGTGAELKAAENFSINRPLGARQILTLDTDDGKVITVNGEIYHRPESGTVNTLTVKGSGTVAICNTVARPSGESAFTGDVVITNTATLAINAGKTVTAGAITVNTNATLQVAQSGTVALGGGLTLKEGATLGFNYTTKDAPVLNLTDKTVMFDEGATTNVIVKISADAGKRAKGGANVLTSGGKFAGVNVSLADGKPAWALGVSLNETGDIVLDVKPMGTVFLVR